MPLREVQERSQAGHGTGQAEEHPEGAGREPVHGGAAVLADYLFGRLAALDALDTSDSEAVAAECEVTRAVNDTAKNLIALAEASTKAAMLRSNVTGRMDVPAFFLQEGEGR